ncbi:diaminopimelate epimerase [Gammaproteobacteria bacterium]
MLDNVIHFTKMHGLGNDFVIIDALRQQITLTPTLVRFFADRHFGIGCDQVLLVEHSERKGLDFRYRIFNADGGEVEQCGNGARCFARFVREEGLTNKDQIAVETAAGEIFLRIEKNGEVTVNMGKPCFIPEAIPFLADQEAIFYSLLVTEQKISCGVVSIGNPHCVLRIDNIATANETITTLGPILEHHERFPQRVNVGFMEVVTRESIKLRVHERGVGETLACGTGACAAVAVGIRQGLLDPRVIVDLPGGQLTIHWPSERDPISMTGPAARVFDGTIELAFLDRALLKTCG